MWRRMKAPGLILVALIDLAISTLMAALLVFGFGWRYSDWLGLTTQPFDASFSFVVYTVLGAVVWPVGLILLSLVIGDWRRNARRAAPHSR